MVDPETTPEGEPLTFVQACVHLRTKTQFYREPDMEQAPGMIVDSPRLSYWCDRTADHVGPDQKGCDPAACQRGRDCYADAGGLA